MPGGAANRRVPIFPMTYQLRPGLSFGFIGDRAVLLDLHVDRYYLLGVEAAQSLRAIMAGRADCETHRRLLQRDGQSLIVEGNDGIAPVEAALPNVSVLETEGRGGVNLPLRPIFAAQIRANVSLRFLGIKHTIAVWRKARPAGVSRRISTETMELAQSFVARRPAVPIRRSCVPDSLALLRLLWRQGLDGDLLFGVRLEPFAAHCWVQADDCLLSDPVANVLSFTPVFRL